MATLVINETVFRVVGVKLAEKAVIIHGHYEGALARLKADVYDVSLHGDDGTLIASGTIECGWPRTYDKDSMDILWPIRALEQHVEPAHG